MDREEFDSGMYQEMMEDYMVMDYELARDEMFDDEHDWTEYDERVLQESWEMDAERDRDVEAFRNMTPQQIVVDAETFDWLQRMVLGDD